MAAGLPNIEAGNIRLSQGASITTAPTGAFVSGAKGSNAGAGESSNRPLLTGFDASLSNPLYSSSDTVQPPTVKLCPALYLGRSA